MDVVNSVVTAYFIDPAVIHYFWKEPNAQQANCPFWHSFHYCSNQRKQPIVKQIVGKVG
jgi:hypothetical protein